MLFMGMGGDNLCDCRLDLAKVPLKRFAHFGPSGVDSNPSVEHCGEELAKKQGNRVWQCPIQKQDGQLAIEQIEPPMVCSPENADPLNRSPDTCPHNKRQP